MLLFQISALNFCLRFHGCDSSGYWTMKAGWHFSSLWILRIYPVSEQRFMHIRAGLLIYSAHANNNSSSNNSIIDLLSLLHF
jgi:hypothetical protein